MNVKQLRKALKRLDPKAEVWVATDEEGNSFLPVDGWGYHPVFDNDVYDYEPVVVIWP